MQDRFERNFVGSQIMSTDATERQFGARGGAYNALLLTITGNIHVANTNGGKQSTVCFFSTETKEDGITQLNYLSLTSAINQFEVYCLAFYI